MSKRKIKLNNITVDQTKSNITTEDSIEQVEQSLNNSVDITVEENSNTVTSNQIEVEANTNEKTNEDVVVEDNNKVEVKYDYGILNGSIDGHYGKPYYNGAGPYTEDSFTEKDIFAREYVKILESIYDFVPGMQFLDLACCRGAYVKELLKYGMNGVGIDFSEYSYQTRCIDEKYFLKYDLTSNPPIPFENNSFDFILANDILEHLYENDSLRLAKDIYRVLKPGCYAHVNIGVGVCDEHVLLKDFMWWSARFTEIGFKICNDKIIEFQDLRKAVRLFANAQWDNLFVLRK